MRSQLNLGVSRTVPLPNTLMSSTVRTSLQPSRGAVVILLVQLALAAVALGVAARAARGGALPSAFAVAGSGAILLSSVVAGRWPRARTALMVIALGLVGAAFVLLQQDG